jgi:hypothetical protein
LLSALCALGAAVLSRKLSRVRKVAG